MYEPRLARAGLADRQERVHVLRPQVFRPEDLARHGRVCTGESLCVFRHLCGSVVLRRLVGYVAHVVHGVREDQTLRDALCGRVFRPFRSRNEDVAHRVLRFFGFVLIESVCRENQTLSQRAGGLPDLLCVRIFRRERKRHGHGRDVVVRQRFYCPGGGETHPVIAV